MVAKKWMRLVIAGIFVLVLVKIGLQMRGRDPKFNLDKEFEFAALIREKSGAKKRIPPDFNYTDPIVAVERFDNDSISKSEHNKEKDAWRSRKLINPQATPRLVLDPEVEEAIWMKVTNHTTLPLKEMRALAKKPFLVNREGLAQFRKQLDDFKASVWNAVLTKSNTREGQTLQFSFNRDVAVNVTSEMLGLLPKESPFSNLKLKRCAVVGASGILLNSRCGNEIDSSDFIFRCNIPDLIGYEGDVGASSNLTTINTVSILARRFKYLQTIADSKKFIRTLQRYQGLLWMPVFGVKHGLSYNMRTARLINRTTDLPNLRLIVSNPAHFSATHDFWMTKFFSSRISTGIYLTTLALALCEETHVYGFWPYSRDLNLQPSKYHYYDNLDGPLTIHSFLNEFLTLLKMHQDGVLQLHLGPCA